jgi:hypothetical protein
MHIIDTNVLMFNIVKYELPNFFEIIGFEVQKNLTAQ